MVCFKTYHIEYFDEIGDICVESVGGVRETTYIEARATAQARETPHSYPKPEGNGFMGSLTYKVFNLYYFI